MTTAEYNGERWQQFQQEVMDNNPVLYGMPVPHAFFNEFSKVRPDIRAFNQAFQIPKTSNPDATVEPDSLGNFIYYGNEPMTANGLLLSKSACMAVLGKKLEESGYHNEATTAYIHAFTLALNARVDEAKIDEIFNLIPDEIKSIDMQLAC